MTHKYLYELETYEDFIEDREYQESEDQWVEDRAVYGFPSYETYDLEDSFYLWLYEHIRMFMDKAEKEINFGYHRYDFKGKTYTQGEMMKGILDRIKLAFSRAYDPYDPKEYTYVHEIPQMWALILPAIWW